MNKQNGIIKLCLLMAFVSYFIWNQNEKKLSQPQLDEQITSIINQVKSINQKEKNDSIIIPVGVKNTSPIMIINDETISSYERYFIKF